MTSEPDSAPRRRPPTIDLTAREVEAPEPGVAPGATVEEAEGRAPGAAANGAGEGNNSGSRQRAKPYAVGAIVGAIVVGAILVGLWIAGLVPPQTAAAPSAPGAKAASTDEISSRLDKIQQALQTPHDAGPALAARVSAAEAQTRSLAESLAALQRHLDEVAVVSQSALAQAKAAAAAVEEIKNAAHAGAEQSDIDALNNRGEALNTRVEALDNRLTALEGTMKSLSAAAARPSADDHAVRLAVAAAALRAAVESGAPYRPELAAVQALGADQTATAPLEPFAAGGVPSAAALAREFGTLTPSLLQASGAQPSEGSFLGRLEAHAQRLVRITPIDARAGDDPASVIARINGDAARGDISAALAGVARLPEPARVLAASWVKRAEARQAAFAASRRIAAEALAAIGGAAPQ